MSEAGAFLARPVTDVAVSRDDRVAGVENELLGGELLAEIVADFLQSGIGHGEQDHVSEGDGLRRRSRMRQGPRPAARSFSSSG